MTDYPYMISNNKIAPIINKIQQAARPAKFTQEVLKNLGFTSTNDRAFTPLAKRFQAFWLMMGLQQRFTINLKIKQRLRLF